ncbi:MAG: sulfite exporter TauE/SafE family protein [Micrococcales bacterium]
MDFQTFGFLVLAGVAAGLTGSIAGLASVASYPALILAGLSPIQANVTNTIALSALSFGSIPASKPEWSTQRPLLKRLIPVTLLGGVTGGILLLNTDPVTFGQLAPILIIASSFVVLIPRKENAKTILKNPWLLGIVMFAVGIYCGYFGAGAGSATVAIMILAVGVNLTVASSLKNVLMFFANTMAMIIFIFSGQVAWLYAIPLALGFFVGGRVGPILLRKLNAKLMRWFVAGLGFVVGISMLFK